MDFNTIANDLKTSGMALDIESFTSSITSIMKSIELKCMRNNVYGYDLELLLTNPNEITLEIGKKWGQEISKLFFVVSDRDTSKIGKLDYTNRYRAELFYYFAKYYGKDVERAEFLYYCLIFHILNYEKEKVLSTIKRGVIQHSPVISANFFGFKKNDIIYSNYMSRFVTTPEGEKCDYLINVPNFNHIALLNKLYEMTPADARKFLEGKKMGILEDRIPLEVEERLLPFLLSESGEVLQKAFSGVVAEDFKEMLDAINHKSGKPNSYHYAFNSNPYTFFVTGYKKNTLDNIINELERLYPQAKYPFISDSTLGVVLNGTKVNDEGVNKVLKPVSSARLFMDVE